jgi:Mg-chelatase subunit ChlI
MKKRIEYPFTAIVGQEMMKKALILNLINPSLGGVLIRGEKGTAKSTAVRALAELMQDRMQVRNCVFNCDPNNELNMCNECSERKKTEDLHYINAPMKIVELPVSATEDRVVGTLDIEQAIKEGEKKFEPGILAQANRNILYVDEVNLLDDHIIDILLDSAAMGVNIVEREGISYVHPAKFILVGTMNLEEGDLRPQLLDRFGMVTDVIGEKDVEMRMEVVLRRLEYEQDNEAFVKKYEKHQNQLREQINKAKDLLNQVKLEDKFINLISKISIELGVDGHRADITMAKTAMTIAALNNRNNLEINDIKEAALLVLPHRMRRLPFEEGQLDFSRIEKIIENWK